MSDKSVNSETLENLKDFDETGLLDSTESLHYIKTLLDYGSGDEKSNLHSDQFLELFKKVSQIKHQNKSIDQTDLWDEAIELEKTLWFAGDAINQMLTNLYDLLSTNSKLGYEIEYGEGEWDDFDDEDGE